MGHRHTMLTTAEKDFKNPNSVSKLQTSGHFPQLTKINELLLII